MSHNIYYLYLRMQAQREQALDVVGPAATPAEYEAAGVMPRPPTDCVVETVSTCRAPTKVERLLAEETEHLGGSLSYDIGLAPEKD